MPEPSVTPWSPTIPTVTTPDGYRLRELPPDEWLRLSETDGPYHGKILPIVSSCKIAVIESPEARILAHWLIFDAVHADGLWFAEELRHHAHVTRAFIGMIVVLLQTLGVTYINACIRDADLPTHAPMALGLGLTDQGCRLFAGPVPAAPARDA